MKTIIAFFCLTVVAVSAASGGFSRTETQYGYKEIIKEMIVTAKSRQQIEVNANEYLDSTLKVVRLWIIKHGLDPLQTEDLMTGFSIKLGLITISGDFGIENGWLQGLNSVERGGDAFMKYDSQILQLELPVAFNTMLVNYDYKIKFMNLGPTGGVEGKIKNLKLFVDIAVDTRTLEITLQSFKIIDAGKITIRFSGNPITDILVNTISGLATKMLHGVAVRVVENQVREALENFIEGVNKGLHPQNNMY